MGGNGDGGIGLDPRQVTADRLGESDLTALADGSVGGDIHIFRISEKGGMSRGVRVSPVRTW